LLEFTAKIASFFVLFKHWLRLLFYLKMAFLPSSPRDSIAGSRATAKKNAYGPWIPRSSRGMTKIKWVTKN